MKLIHTADVHLGAVPDAEYPWGPERAESIWETFAALIGYVRTERADLLVISGDLFHQIPSIRELEAVNRLFRSIPQTAVVLCAGNHDPVTAESPYPDFDWGPNVAGLWSETLTSVAIPGRNTRVYGCSYTANEAPYDLYEGAQPSGAERYHILLLHGGDAKHSPVTKEKLAKMPFDYIAMGHIHKPGYVIRNKAAYAGALVPIDRNDLGNHGFLKAQLRGALPPQIEFVPFAPFSYEVLPVQTLAEDTVGEVEDRIRRKIRKYGAQNSWRVQIEGTCRVANALEERRLWDTGHVLSIEDHTGPALDYAALCEKNPGTLLDAYIRRLADRTDSVGRIALEEGTKVLLEQML